MSHEIITNIIAQQPQGYAGAKLIRSESWGETVKTRSDASLFPQLIMSNPSTENTIHHSSVCLSRNELPNYEPPKYADTQGREEDIGHLICEVARVSVFNLYRNILLTG